MPSACLAYNSVRDICAQIFLLIYCVMVMAGIIHYGGLVGRARDYQKYYQIITRYNAYQRTKIYYGGKIVV